MTCQRPANLAINRSSVAREIDVRFPAPGNPEPAPTRRTFSLAVHSFFPGTTRKKHFVCTRRKGGERVTALRCSCPGTGELEGFKGKRGGKMR